MTEPETLTPTPLPELMTTREVCAALRISRPTLAAWCLAGDFPYVTLPGGRHRRYRRADVEAVLFADESTSTAAAQ